MPDEAMPRIRTYVRGHTIADDNFLELQHQRYQQGWGLSARFLHKPDVERNDCGFVLAIAAAGLGDSVLAGEAKVGSLLNVEETQKFPFCSKG